MFCIVKRVIVFTKNEKKNEIKFKEGLNIVSGVSQTGKSAILEIIDYCLASSASSIPKGVITDSSILYSTVYELDKIYLILARRPFFYENNKEWGKTKIFIKVEPKEKFNIDEIEYEYFYNNKSCYRKIDDAMREIEAIMGVAVYKKVSAFEEEKTERVSIRSTMSYILQHQNLIANKFALYYRFDDSFKRKKAINEFPIFLGIVDQEYYDCLQKKEKYEKELRKIEREKKFDNEYNKEIEDKLGIEIKEYYQLIGRDISDKNIKDIIFERQKLDKFIIEELNLEKSMEVYNELENELDNINADIMRMENKLNNINKTLQIGNDLEEKVENIINLNNITVGKQNLTCPFCQSTVKELSEEILKVQEAKNNLVESLDSISIVKDKHLENEKFKLQEKLKEYKQNQNRVKQRIREIKNKHKMVEQRLDLRELILEKKIRIQEEIKKASLLRKDDTSKIDDINAGIEQVKKKLDGYDVDKELNEIEVNINKFMVKVAERLDFEKGKIINLKFDSRTFDLYQLENKEKIFLSNMGSGSNWLTCHLSLFLAFQYCFANRGNKCSVPTMLIIDQPSQVYFPDLNSQEKDIDIISVENIYKAINWAINYIEKKTALKIQVIALDHVNGLKFEDDNFEDNIIKRWNEKGNGLIEKNNIYK